MGLIQFDRLLSKQPQTVVGVNWGDPITKGLIGLVWMGPGIPRDLVSPLTLSTGATKGAGKYGLASIVAAGSAGAAYTARNGYGGWALPTVPLTLAALFNHSTPAGSSALCGTTINSYGYGILDRYGGRYRLVAANVGGTYRTLESGQWGSEVSVRAMTVTKTELAGYENGAKWGSITYTAATDQLAYDTTYGRLDMLGNIERPAVAGEAYWMALWNRVLTDKEHQRLAADPWCLFKPKRIWVPGSAGGGGTYNVTLAESAAAADALGAVGSIVASVAEAAAASELASTGGTVAAAVSESAAAAETLAAVAAVAAALTEPATVADLVAATMVAQAAVAEALAAAEVVSAGPQVSGAMAEAATAADALTVTASLVAQVAEAASAADAAATAQQLLALITEASTVADQVSGAAPAAYSVTLAEVAAALDVITAALTGTTVWPLLAARGVSAHAHGSARPEQLSTATRSNVQ